LTFKNNRWYGGQRGAIGSEQVQQWTDELNKATEGVFMETAKSIGELDKQAGGKHCGCQ